jgi:hypothetical protein
MPPRASDLLTPWLAVFLLPIVFGAPLAFAADAPKPPPTPQEQGLVVVTGLPSVIELQEELVGDPPPRCIHFRVSIVGKPSGELHVSSVGVDGARLFEMTAQNAKATCASRATATQATVVLRNVDVTERTLTLFLPADAFPGRSEGAGGKLLLTRLDAPLAEEEFVLRREPAPYERLITWLAGVFTPLIVGAMVYLVKNAYERRQGQRKAIEDVRDRQASEIERFFERGGLYQSTVQLAPGEGFAAGMDRELERLQIYQGMTSSRADRLHRAVQEEDRDKVKQLLVDAFPAHADAIRQAHGS